MRPHSKLIVFPEFCTLPGTDAANVEENIVNWINKDMTNKLNTFCIPDTTRPNGYRFKCCSDFEEMKDNVQLISKVPVRFVFQRRVHTFDHLCPLYFSEWYVKVEVFIGEENFEFKSDAHLKRMIKEYKNVLQ